VERFTRETFKEKGEGPEKEAGRLEARVPVEPEEKPPFVGP